jgi:hypothetical protein
MLNEFWSQSKNSLNDEDVKVHFIHPKSENLNNAGQQYNLKKNARGLKYVKPINGVWDIEDLSMQQLNSKCLHHVYLFVVFFILLLLSISH